MPLRRALNKWFEGAKVRGCEGSVRVKVRGFTGAFVFGAAVSIAAQEPSERATLKDYEYEVTMSGCLKGKRLERPVIVSAPDTLPPDAREASGFMLEGDKALLKQIEREHKNHADQIVGVVTIPPNLARSLTRKLGPISVGFGTPGMNRSQNAEQVFRLRVTSLVHVQDRCATR